MICLDHHTAAAVGRSYETEGNGRICAYVWNGVLVLMHALTPRLTSLPSCSTMFYNGESVSDASRMLTVQ
jgi:hypothetical protein